MVDLFLLSFFGGYVFGGWRTGFIRRLASLGFLAVSFVAAAYLREPVAGIIEALFPDMRPEYPGFIAFAVTFGVLLIALNIVSKPILSRMAVGGLSRAADRALGAVLGLAEAVLLASIGIVIVTTYANDEMIGGFAAIGVLPDISEALEGSSIARVLMATTVPLVLTLLGPLLPPDIKSVIDVLPSGE